jgi:hypothetical protein
MSHRTSLEASPPPSATGRELLSTFIGRNRGFQAFRQSSYLKHEAWRHTVLEELQRLEGEGLVVIRQLIPCTRHSKCCGRPIAAGCELTREGRRIRDEALAAVKQG